MVFAVLASIELISFVIVSTFPSADSIVYLPSRKRLLHDSMVPINRRNCFYLAIFQCRYFIYADLGSLLRLFLFCQRKFTTEIGNPLPPIRVGHRLLLVQ